MKQLSDSHIPMASDEIHEGQQPANDGPAPAENGVMSYKRILQTICDNRPSGTRGRLAVALGTNRSFVSQLVSPTYAVPIPAQHLETIFEVCRFSSSEQTSFLDTYDRAHPGRRASVGGLVAARSLTLDVPDLGSPSKNDMFDDLIKKHIRSLSRLYSAL